MRTNYKNIIINSNHCIQIHSILHNDCLDILDNVVVDVQHAQFSLLLH